jgi:WD40 repeat protein
VFTLRRRRALLKALAFSPDGSLLAAGGDRGGVQVWDLQRRALAAEIKPDPNQSVIYSVAFGAKDRVVSANYTQVRTLDLTTGDVARELENVHWIYNVAMSPDRTAVCVATAGCLWCFALNDGARRVWQRTDYHYGTAAHHLHWSADGRTIATGRADGRVQLLDAATGEVRRTALNNDTMITGMTLSPDGRTLVYCASTTLGVLRLAGDFHRQQRLGRTHFHAPTFHPTGTFFGTVNGDGSVDYWDAATAERSGSLSWQVGKLNALAFDPGGDRAACSGESGDIIIWDVDR